jgi:hypothetical protein
LDLSITEERSSLDLYYEHILLTSHRRQSAMKHYTHLLELRLTVLLAPQTHIFPCISYPSLHEEQTLTAEHD